MHKVWQFRAGRFTVKLLIKRDRNYRYDGDDSDGETQAKLDNGEYVAFDSLVQFDSIVQVELNGEVIGSDSLRGSVYEPDAISDFWTEHRSPDPMNRNCSIMRKAHGSNVCICHHFPDMVANAIAEARDHVRSMTIPPYIRESAT